ncbi:hypothetical protein [Streptomyces sp. SP18CS02]|uniref:hypothetical protein n=1 Tax=Streptomyces sp. SP18CS02 TaxID=3002531 RepID=UPI002E78B5CC|nr:hypothetical protein [Streptomyces sp. SP18CS02]MEE1751535.1 hypothetical protein [Streptomyces sp. SP18CS02]
MKADPLPPRFCQNTGGYLWQIADYLGEDRSRSTDTAGAVLARPRRPEPADRRVWPASLPPDLLVHRAGDTVGHRPAAAVLASADHPRAVLVNRRAGSFAELPVALADAFDKGVRVGDLDRVEVSGVTAEAPDLVVALLRHGLLASRPVAGLRGPDSGTAYRSEPTAWLDGRSGRTFVVNRLTGRALRISEGGVSLLEDCRLRPVVPEGVDAAVLDTLTAAGILRPVAGTERER